MAKIKYSEVGMIEGARRQYRDYFKGMALGGRWGIFRTMSGDSLSGVVLAPYAECEGLIMLVSDVQAKSEETMATILSGAIRLYGVTADFQE